MEAIAENRKESPSTPGFDLVIERVNKMILENEPDRYPNGTAFIGADYPNFAALVKQYADDRCPIAVIFPDGGEVIATPARNRVVRALRRVLSRLDRRGNGVVPPELVSVPLPADYVVELRERVAST